MKILETERLLLRTFQEDDVESMISINQDKKVMQFFPSVPNEEATIAFIDKVIAHQEQHGFSLYATEIKKTGEMIGFVGLFTATFKAHFTPQLKSVGGYHRNTGIKVMPPRLQKRFLITLLTIESWLKWFHSLRY